jgi:hypothetical protein
VDVDPAPVGLRELEDTMDLSEPELGRRLVMRDPADAVGPDPKGLLEPLLVGGIGVDPVLGECGHLDRDEVGELIPECQEAAKGCLVRPAHVGVGADVKRPLGDRPGHDLPRPREHVLDGERALELTPDVDPLDEGPRPVVARPPRGQARVEMEVAVDERRCREPPVRVDLPAAVEPEVGPDLREAAFLDR